MRDDEAYKIGMDGPAGRLADDAGIDSQRITTTDRLNAAGPEASGPPTLDLHAGDASISDILVKPVPRKLHGHIDRADSTEIVGWVWDPNAPDHRVRLELVDGSRRIATAVADIERPGLEKAGIGDGRHEFRFALAKDFPTEGKLQLHLRCADTLIPVPGSPVHIDRGARHPIPGEGPHIAAAPAVAAEHDAAPGKPDPGTIPFFAGYLLARARVAEAELARISAASLASEQIENRFFRPGAKWAFVQNKGGFSGNAGLIAKRVRTIAESGLFDEGFYVAHPNIDMPDGMGPIEHFIRIGWLQAKDPHPLFSVRYYLFRYPGLTKSDIDPLTHYVEHGSREMRDPHPLFLTRYYASQLGIESAGSATWLGHFMAESSRPSSPHPIFDDREYAGRAEPGLTSARDALLHYVQTGWKAGLDPSPLFRSTHYRQQTGWMHTDIEPYTHYLLFGVENNLDPHPVFDTRQWRFLTRGSPAQHDPLLEYLAAEQGGKRNPSGLFDVRFYTARHGAEFQGRGALWHYLTEGSRKNYAPHPLFDAAAYRKNYMSRASSKDDTGPLEHFLRSDLLGSQRQKLADVLGGAHPALMQLPAGLLLPDDVQSGADSTQPPGPAMKEYPGKLQHQEGRPNVLLVAHLVGDHFFGSERSFLDMLDGLRSCDCNVFVCLPRNVPDYTNMVRQICERVFVFNFGWWKAGKPASANVQGLFEQLIRACAIDVVHANTIMIEECLAAAQSCKVVSVTHARELITHDRDLADLIGLPVEGVVHAVRSRSDWIIGNSRATATAFAKPERTLLVPNTIDTRLMDIANHVDRSKIRFGLISSNVAKKGLADFVEVARLCAATLANAEFHIIGPPSKYLQQMRSGASGAGLPPNLVFAGYAETPRDAVSQVNVVLNLSHFAESFGRTVLEAMAARRPVIAYAWGALEELIDTEETGFLVPFKDIQAVAACVRTLCENPRLIEQMGANARRGATQRYGLQAYRSAFRKAYAAILPHRVRSLETPAHPVVKPARRPGLKAINLQVKLAYFCWHFPVPSETFVLNELRVLVAGGADVLVFCKASPHPDFKIDFPITFERITTPEDLARRLTETGRSIVHAHFCFPTVTNMVWPACEAARIPFTFIAHAQDIFVHKNAEQNRLAEIGASPWCRAMFTLSRFHYDYVVGLGFPAHKVIINPNAVDLARFSAAANPAAEARTGRRVVAIHRFVEKKGLSALIRAAALIQDLDITIEIYGYGPMEAEYRQIVADNRLENVVIRGALTQSEIPHVLASADLFACPSVRTANGDMDGIPTSMIESMAARVPVLVTAIAGIPDLVDDGISGIVCEPTPHGIAAAIRRAYAMDTLQMRAIIDEASRRVTKRHDAARLVDTLRRVWQNITVDIVVVAWNNLAQLRMVVDSILAHTATPYHLIICDNMSREEPVGAYLDQLWEEEDRVTVVHNDRNAMVGPGTNLALAQGNSDTIIYVCGKEGVCFANAWEMSFVRAFDADDIGLVGTLGYSPSYLTGEHYPSGVRLFDKFRNRDFATSNPKRMFRHVQGGLFGLRRRMVDEIGGFSDDVPHDYTDVEYSFYAESRGWRLGEASNVLALFNKTRPSLSQRFRDDIAVAHPVLPAQVGTFGAVVKGRLQHCNICDWYGESFNAEDSGCPQCGSAPQDRTLFRWLSDSTTLYRRLPALSVGLAGKMQEVWTSQFQGPKLSMGEFTEAVKTKGRLSNAPGSLHIVVVRVGEADTFQVSPLAKEIFRLLAPGGHLLIQPAALTQPAWDELDESVATHLPQIGFKNLGPKRYASRALVYSYLPLWVFSKLDHKAH